jgi:plasmid stabilization system protein ParE
MPMRRHIAQSAWLEDIFEYIAADSPQAAARTVQGIYERTQYLRRALEVSTRHWRLPPSSAGT